MFRVYRVEGFWGFWWKELAGHAFSSGHGTGGQAPGRAGPCSSFAYRAGDLA